MEHGGVQRQLTDLAKVIAAIAVVGIHATSTAETNFALHHNFLSLDFAGVFLNQWARFSVPLFLYLSAYGLAVSDKSSDEKLGAAFIRFISRRLPAILIPYLFFSIVALALNFRNQTPASILTALRTGGADYHLYFLVILAQCYLLFPLLVWMYHRSPRLFRFAVLLTFLLVVFLLYKTASERVLSYFGLTHPGWHASFCIYWLPYFMLGVLHGAGMHRGPQSHGWLSADDAKGPPMPWKLRTALAAAFVFLILVFHDYIYYSSLGTPVDYYNHFSRPSVALYALAVIYLLHSLTPQPPLPDGEGGEDGSTRLEASSLTPLSLRRGGAFLRGGEVLAPLTFSVYLIHPQILRVLNAYAPNMAGIFVWLITVAIAFPLVYLITKLLGKFENPLVKFLQRALGLR